MDSGLPFCHLGSLEIQVAWDDLHPFHLAPIVPWSGVIPLLGHPAKHMHALHTPAPTGVPTVANQPLAAY